MIRKSNESKGSYLESLDDRSLALEGLNGRVSEVIGVLYTRYNEKIKKFVEYFVGDKLAAEDITNGVFIKGLEKFSSYNPEYAFSSWLYSIARNESFNHLRRKRRESKLFGRDINAYEFDGEVPHDIEGISIDGNNFHPLDRIVLERAISELKPVYREAFDLIHKQGHTYRDASARLQTPVGTLKSRADRAREKIKEYYGNSKIRKFNSSGSL